MSTPIVQVRNLRKTYGPKVAVADVSFDVQRGEIFGILGPNGAGKSTTVECVAGLREADAGQIFVEGIDVRRHPDQIRGILGIQFQQAEMHDKITVREALKMFAAFHAKPANPEELIHLLDLEDKADARFASLSGGQKQRVSIALALVGNPRIAILDELTTGLDPQTRRNIWAVVERLRDAGITIILVSHYMDEVERLADRLIIIDAGLVVAHGTPTELVAQTPGATNLEDVFVAVTNTAVTEKTLSTIGVN